MLYNFPDADKKPFRHSILKTFIETCAKRNPDLLFEVSGASWQSYTDTVNVTCSGLEVGTIGVYVNSNNEKQIHLNNAKIEAIKQRNGGYKTKDLKKAYRLFKEFFNKPTDEAIVAEELAAVIRGKQQVARILNDVYGSLRGAAIYYLDDYSSDVHDFDAAMLGLANLREAKQEHAFFDATGTCVVLAGGKVHYCTGSSGTIINTCSIEDFPADELTKVLSLKILEDGKHVMGVGYKHSHRSFWING